MEHNHRLSRAINSEPETIAHAALAVFGAIALLVTVTSIVESYANLVAFGMAHQMTAWHGIIAPVAVDSFIVMGELLLFAELLLHWYGRSLYLFAGALVFGGFAMSVGGNVFRATPLPLWADRSVQAIWPITATAALTGCLIILKRLMAGRDTGMISPAGDASESREDYAREDNRGTGETVAPLAAARTLPSAPRKREPHQAPPGRAARTAELTAASEHEHQVALRLREDLARGDSIPGRRPLAISDFGGNQRAAGRAIQRAKAGMNGAGSGDVGRS